MSTNAVAVIGFIVLVGLARVLLHAHWPSDVLGGVLLGVIFTSCAALVTDDDSPPPRT